MIAPSIIHRSNRRSLALTINDNGDLIVKAPFNMSLDEIFKFIEQKQKWISQKQEKTKAILNQNYELINFNKLLFLGKEYKIVFTKGIEKPYLLGENLVLNYTKSLNSIKTQIKAFLLENCDDVLIPRIVKLASKMNLKYKQIKIINSKAKWGICDNNKNIYFNLKLLMLPHEYIDYVIVHELSHLVFMNHSDKFWKLVNSYIPNVKQIRNNMKNCGFIIKLF